MKNSTAFQIGCIPLNFPLIITLFIVIAATSITSITGTSVILTLMAGIVLMLIFAVVKVNALQLLLLATIIPPLINSRHEQFGNLGVAVGILVFLFWVVGLFVVNKGKLQTNKYSNMLVGINLFFAIITFISSIYNSALNTIAIMEIFRFVLYALLILLSYHYISDIEYIQKIKWAGLFGAIVYAVLGYKIILNAGQSTVLLYGAAFLHGATVGLANSNTIATVIANPMPFLLAYCMFGSNKWIKRAYWAAFIFIFIVWMAWNSRSSYVYLFIAFITLAAFHRHRWRYFIVTIVGTGIFVGLSLTDTIPYLSDFLRLSMGVSHRDAVWQAGFRMLIESPILGKSPSYFDQFKYYYMDPSISRNVIGTFMGISPHNVLIMRGTDMGMFAILAQLFYWIIPSIYFIKKAKEIKDSKHYHLYLACGAVWIGMIFRSQFDTGASVFAMILLGVIFKMPQLTKKTDNISDLADG